MNITEFKSFFEKELKSIYPQTEIDAFFFLLIEDYLNLQRIDLVLTPSYLISDKFLPKLHTALERLKNEEPIQYILGKTDFFGLPFKVSTNTLIPRPETEELVEWVLQEANKCKPEHIIDIGTGTGCIPISLKKHLPNTTVLGIDISREALQIAKENSNLNSVDVQFRILDILTTNSLNVIDDRTNKTKNHKIDIIISNPPYVRELEKIEIKNNVLNNEPHLALFVEDDNPLIFYKKIAELATKHLSENGLLFFEINQYLGKETVEMLKIKGFKNIELKKDFSGKDRMIKASLHN